MAVQINTAQNATYLNIFIKISVLNNAHKEPMKISKIKKSWYAQNVTMDAWNAGEVSIINVIYAKKTIFYN